MDELAAVAELVEQHRLVTIVGPGGVGKSTLASAVVSSSSSAALFAEMSSLRGDDINTELAGALGFRSWEDLDDALRSRKTLLVIDNGEHLTDELAGLIRDLSSTEDLTILVTSREPLNVGGERIFLLAPLSLEGRPSPAAALLCRFMEVRGLPAPGDLDEVEALCESLDGLPLALELAAGSAAALTLAEIRVSVETRLDVLSRVQSRQPERSSSLDATIAWSLDLLDPKSRSFLEVLSVFEGAFSLDLALAMGQLEDPADGLILLRTLVDKSLLIHAAPGNGSWYRMLNTVRTHCRQRLVNAGKWAEASDRLVGAVLEICDRMRTPQVHMGDPRIPNQVFQSFHNIREAARWCLANDQSPDRVDRMMLPLFWLEDVGHQAEAVDLLRRVVDRWEHQTSGATWGVLANLEKAAGKLTSAGSSGLRAIETGDPLGVILGHRVLGTIDRQSGRPDESLGHSRLGAATARDTGWDAFALELEAHAAMAVAGLGRVDEAIDELEALSEESDAYPLCHRCIEIFRSHLLMHHDPARAVAVAAGVIDEARRHGHTWAVGGAAYEVGVAALLSGDTPAGARYLADAVEAFDSARSLAELHQTLLIVSSLLEDAGFSEQAMTARAGIAHLPARSIAITDRTLLDRLGVEMDPQPPVGASFDLHELVEALRQLGDQTGPMPTGQRSDHSRFLARGDVWELSYGGTTVFVRDSKGMGDLSQLLSRPGREMAALDLIGAGVVESDPGPAIDLQARSEYEARIRELQASIEDAESANDPYRAEQASTELEQLVEQLTSSYGLGRRARVSDTAEKARSAVTWRIRAAIDRIRDEHAPLGDHLDRTVRTGRFCVYAPDPEVSWET